MDSFGAFGTMLAEDMTNAIDMLTHRGADEPPVANGPVRIQRWGHYLADNVPLQQQAMRLLSQRGITDAFAVRYSPETNHFMAMNVRGRVNGMGYTVSADGTSASVMGKRSAITQRLSPMRGSAVRVHVAGARSRPRSTTMRFPSIEDAPIVKPRKRKVRVQTSSAAKRASTTTKRKSSAAKHKSSTTKRKSSVTKRKHSSTKRKPSSTKHKPSATKSKSSSTKHKSVTAKRSSKKGKSKK